MRDVAIIGVGMTPVGEHWDKSLRVLAGEAIQECLSDAQINSVDALYVGNAYGSSFSAQSHLGPLITDHVGLTGIEAFTIEAGDASGAAALRTGYLAVASGFIDTVMIVGVEKSTDSIAGSRVRARNISLDADMEAVQGATLPSLAAMLMRRYMYEYQLGIDAFEGFSINAHANGKLNKYAMFRNLLKVGSFAKAPLVADPVNLFDNAPDADGAAAVILTTTERAVDLVPKPVLMAGSAAATDTLMLQDREDLLSLSAVKDSIRRALNQAGVKLNDLDLFELQDGFTILSALSLEAAGFAERGEGWRWAVEYETKIGLKGQLPISTFGGLKSRGNPVGATGIYQAVEASLQLRGDATDNQVDGAKVALIQNLGGLGSTAIAHVLKAM